MNELQIVQPAWAGKGDFLKVVRASARLSILDVLTGNANLRSIIVTSLDVALVREAKGNSNWAGRAGKPSSPSDDAPTFDRLLIDTGRFTLRDAKRRLDIAGTIAASGTPGLAVDAAGSFDEAPDRLTAHGKPVTGQGTSDAWPYSADLVSAVLVVTATGITASPLNFRDMTMKMTAKGTSLKKLY